MKYMVMECRLGYAVVLDEEGRFLKVANMRYQVGQTVSEVAPMQAPPKEKKKKNVWLRAAGGLAACLVLAAAVTLQMESHASVYLTVNPDVRIDVNRFDIVVGLEGVNSDGQRLTEGMGYRLKSLDQVIDDLMDRAIDMGYLHEGGQITLALDSRDDGWAISRGETLNTHLQEYLREKMSVTIQIEGMNAGSHEVIIPVTPNSGAPESSYSEDSYQDAVAPESIPESIPAPVSPPVFESTPVPESAPAPEPPVQTQPPAASVTPPRDDGQTDYGSAVSEESQSDYSPTASSEDSQSDYSSAVSEDSQSDYSSTASEDGQSNYSSTASEDDDSNDDDSGDDEEEDEEDNDDDDGDDGDDD